MDYTDKQKVDGLVILIREQGTEFDEAVKSCEAEAAEALAAGDTEKAAELKGKADAYDYASQMMRDLLKPIGEF